MAPITYGKKKVRLRKKILIYTSIFFSILCISLFLYTSVFKIQKVEIVGAKHTDTGLIGQDIDNILDRRFYLIFPGRNLFLYQKKVIADKIKSTYAGVETIDMSIDRHRVLTVRIQDRKALGVWCSDTCFFYDKEGVLFKKSFAFTGALFSSWKYKTVTSEALFNAIDCKDLCTDERFLDFLKKYSIVNVLISDDALEMKSMHGYIIKSGFVASTTIKHINQIYAKKPNLFKNLEYIDVRFDNKVFYKEKEVSD